MFLGEDISINIHHKLNVDRHFMHTVLSEIPKRAGLNGHGIPMIYHFPNKEAPQEHGVSGIQLMVESHVAGHDWPDGRTIPGMPYCHITISSCKQVNINDVVKYLKRVFMTDKIIYERALWRNPE
jgi:S-adenosylmethionine/arginine decarboxylase-like enzyme